jgi:hypothetical protein
MHINESVSDPMACRELVTWRVSRYCYNSVCTEQLGPETKSTNHKN